MYAKGMYEQWLIESGVVANGHFLLTSGRHSDTYISKDAIYCIPELFELTIEILLYRIQKTFHGNFDVITGPAIAGAVLAVPLAMKLRKVFVYPEKIDDEMVFRRGYDNVLNKQRVVMVEDIATTGGSILKTKNAIQQCGGSALGVFMIWNRSNFYFPGWHTEAIINKEVPSWDPEECPICETQQPLQDPK
jgi:orotate phosphoribosyltransferase